MRFVSAALAIALAVAGTGISAATREAQQLEARSGVAGGSSGGDDPGKNPLPWYMDPTKGGHQKDKTGRGVNLKKGSSAGEKARSTAGKKGEIFRKGTPHGDFGRLLGTRVWTLKSELGLAKNSRAGKGSASRTDSQAPSTSKSSSGPIRNRPNRHPSAPGSSRPPSALLTQNSSQPTQLLQSFPPVSVGRPAATQPLPFSASPLPGQHSSPPSSFADLQLLRQRTQRPSPSSSSRQAPPPSASQGRSPGTQATVQPLDPFANLAHRRSDDLPKLD